jgi:hypothetical protein
MHRSRKTTLSCLIAAALIIQQIFFSFSFAQNTVISCTAYTPDCKKKAICGTQSDEFQMYINFMVDMVAALRSAAVQQQAKAASASVGLISSNVL